jgi:hypothetical protein
LFSAFAGAVAFALAEREAVPWQAGEKLIYRATWQGMVAGQLQLEAQPLERGWSFKGRMTPQGVGTLLGYSLELDSQVGTDLFLTRYRKLLTEPFKGQTRLEVALQNSGLEATITHPNGAKGGWRNATREALDDLSVIYYIRVHPEAQSVRLVQFPRIIEGRLENLGKNREGLWGYRFVQEDAVVEVWYRNDPERTPVRIVYGRDLGRVEASLVETPRRVKSPDR